MSMFIFLICFYERTKHEWNSYEHWDLHRIKGILLQSRVESLIKFFFLF